VSYKKTHVTVHAQKVKELFDQVQILLIRFQPNLSCERRIRSLKQRIDVPAMKFLIKIVSGLPIIFSITDRTHRVKVYDCTYLEVPAKTE